MNFNLIVFDWDGTLMDSEARIVACMQAAMRDLRVESAAGKEVREVIGLGLREAVAGLLPHVEPNLQERVGERYRHHFLEEDKTPSALFPGARELLERLATQGYLLAVATGKGRQGLDKVLRATGLETLFHATRCADETRSKPDPIMLLELMDELGVNARETLMIGDTEYDLLMAQNAGTQAMAVCYGVHSRERLLQHGPLACVADLWELGRWLGVSGFPRATIAAPAA